MTLCGRGKENARAEGDEDHHLRKTRRRAGAESDFTLMRDTIRVQSVRSRNLEEGYGYIRLAQFQERSDL